VKELKFLRNIYKIAFFMRITGETVITEKNKKFHHYKFGQDSDAKNCCRYLVYTRYFFLFCRIYYIIFKMVKTTFFNKLSNLFISGNMLKVKTFEAEFSQVFRHL
jgi:hypothetical protein